MLVPPDPFWGPHRGSWCPQTRFGVPIGDVGALRPILGYLGGLPSPYSGCWCPQTHFGAPYSLPPHKTPHSRLPLSLLFPPTGVSPPFFGVPPPRTPPQIGVGVSRPHAVPSSDPGVPYVGRISPHSRRGSNVSGPPFGVLRWDFGDPRGDVGAPRPILGSP